MDVNDIEAIMPTQSSGPIYPPFVFPPAHVRTESSEGVVNDQLGMDIYGNEDTPWNNSGNMYSWNPYPPPRSDRVPRENFSAAWHSGSTHGRVNSSHSLAPLKVNKYSTSYGSGAAPPLSPNSEKVVATRVEELLRLESPILRELGKRLADFFYIRTPRYEPKKAGGHPYSSHIIGERWKEIQGSFNWARLLDPIDPVLRGEIVRYGEFAQACYDTFDDDTRSKYCGSSKFTRAAILEEVGMENRGYEITEFLYATSEIPLPGFLINSEAKTWSKDSNWMGFVAVCTSTEEIARLGRRDIVIAWRGTKTVGEWIEDVRDFMAPAGFDPRDESETERVMVERGFLSVYTSSNEHSRYNKTSAREQVLMAVRKVIEKYQGETLSITVTGHSLGSALAMLCAYDIAESGMNTLVNSPQIPKVWYSTDENRARELSLWDSQSDPDDSQSRGIRSSILSFFKNVMDGEINSEPESLASIPETSSLSSSSTDGESKFAPGKIPVTVFSFAGPKVGNAYFCERVEKLGVSVLRVANVNDIVTSVPGLAIISQPMKLIHGIVSMVPSYQHVGIELKVDNRHSPYLKETGYPTDTHNLEAYLHLVDGYQGRGKPFEKTQRDFALVNKEGDLLKEEFLIPPMWWQEANKGLIRDENGNWIVPQREPELFPPTPNFDGEPVEDSENPQDRETRRFLRSVSIAIQRSPLEREFSAQGAKMID